MATDYIALLQRFDDPLNGECPLGFDRDQAVHRFLRFADEVAALVGQPIQAETQGDIQDASFHSQIFIPVNDSEFVLVRFSNFGEMVSFSEEVTAPDALRRTLIKLFEKHDYVYVPADVLNEPYSGKNPGVTGIRNWWIRYFDWL